MRRAPNRPITLMLASALCGLAVSSAAIADQATPTVSPTTATPSTDTSTTVSPAAPVAQGAAAPANSGAQASAGTAPAAEPAQRAADAKVTCRTVKTTGSRLQTRKVCSTPDSEKSASDWVRQHQDRGAIGASAIVNGQ
jgi:hypothetical protein